MRHRRPHFYKLIGRSAVPIEDINEWARLFQSTDRIVGKTDIGPLYISTVFLGLDHCWSTDPEAPPMIFETMILDGGKDTYQERYSTWEEAESGHDRAVKYARRLLKEIENG